MTKETTIRLLKEIKTSLKEGTLHINRLKDPNSDCQVTIKIGANTYFDCNELINHYRYKNTMLAYTTIELLDKVNNYYYLEIRDYAKGQTLQNQEPLHTILKRNSCVNPTTRTW